jgi:hypothetical protein
MKRKYGDWLLAESGAKTDFAPDRGQMTEDSKNNGLRFRICAKNIGKRHFTLTSRLMVDQGMHAKQWGNIIFQVGAASTNDMYSTQDLDKSCSSPRSSSGSSFLAFSSKNIKRLRFILMQRLFAG